MTKYRESVEFGGRTLTLETGRLAKQADGACFVEYGDSRVLVTTVLAKEAMEGKDFFPLTVDYIEKTYAAGKISGGFLKREARPKDAEVLVARTIDRPLRPLFDKSFKNETQVVATVLSYDGDNETDVLAMIGASCSTALSGAPWDGPIAGVRVGFLNGEFIANPTPEQRKECEMDIFVASSDSAIMMVEGGAQEASEEQVVNALMFGFDAAQPVIAIQKQLVELAGKARLEVVPPVMPEGFENLVKELGMPGIAEAYAIAEKLPRYAKLSEVKKAVKEQLAEKLDEETLAKGMPFLGGLFDDMKSSYVRDMVIDTKLRIGGRKLDEVRDITCEVGVLPRTHGSALFTRGETQALCTATLATPDYGQRVDDIRGDTISTFFLHYNFPPYSVNEIKRLGSVGRREIGHGTLAHRALTPMVPDDTPEFPYAIRVVSEILESNGSSSMATVCGGTLAMMDAGVPMRKPVAGIAMGLMDHKDQIAVLTDILGDEDHMGDMDFKVCGTKDGITALQMDIKMSGISREILAQALEQARMGRLHILGKMAEALSEPRTELSPFAPRITTIKVNPDRIRDIIGAGGKTIREIVEQTNTQINVDDSGLVSVASSNDTDAQMALEIIRGLTEEPELNKVYNGKVVRITDFGAFIEILPGTDALLHISELEWGRVERVEDVLQEGQEIEVKLIEIERNGRMRLSRRVLLPKPEGWEERPPRDRDSRDSRGSRPPRRDNRGGGRGNNRR